MQSRRLSILLFLYEAATRIASVAYFCRGMLAFILHADGMRLEDGEWWYREPASPWGVA